MHFSFSNCCTFPFSARLHLLLYCCILWLSMKIAETVSRQFDGKKVELQHCHSSNLLRFGFSAGATFLSLGNFCSITKTQIEKENKHFFICPSCENLIVEDTCHPSTLAQTLFVTVSDCCCCCLCLFSVFYQLRPSLISYRTLITLRMASGYAKRYS